MRLYRFRIVLMVGTLGLGLGSGLTLGLRAVATDRAPAADAGAREHATGGPERKDCTNEYSPETLLLVQALSKTLADTEVARRFDMDDPGSWTQIHTEALSKAEVRKELMSRYVQAEDGDGKRMLARLLSSIHRPDVLAFAMGLSAAADPTERRLGFELLAGMGVRLPETRQLALGALKSEKDPTILADAITALQPAAVDPSEADAITKELAVAAAHTHATVRARAVGALASWDKTGASGPFLMDALADSSDEVRFAAIAAIGENRVRSAEIKNALLAVANNPDELPDLRLDAAGALQHFSLDKEESQSVLAIAMNADQEMHDDPGIVEQWPTPAKL